MILPDINLLVFSYNVDSPHHVKALVWWEQALNGDELVGVPWAVILGFLRISTNGRVLNTPLSVEDAVSRVEEWFTMPNVRILHPLGTHSNSIFKFLRQIGTAGNLTTDAHLAALALEHDCTLYSADTDFQRFAGLKVRNPLV